MSEPFAKKTHRVEPKHIFLREFFEIDKRIEPRFKAARRGSMFHDGEYNTDLSESTGGCLKSRLLFRQPLAKRPE